MSPPSWPTSRPANWRRRPAPRRRTRARESDVRLSRVLLLYLPLLVVLVGAALYFAYNPGDVTLEWLGYRLDMHVGAAVFLSVVVFLLLHFLWRVLSLVLHSPQSFSLAMSNSRKARGYRALT